MKRFILTTIIGISLSFPVWSDSISITHVKLREGSTLDQYALDLLKFIVKTSGKEGSYAEFKEVGSQTRKEALIKDGSFDIDWLGATGEIEARIQPIHFPILRGLLGHRIFITNKETAPQLKADMPLSELQKFKVIQGQGWGDVPILEGGGFTNMMTIPNFDNIFKMVENKRTDLFPRSVVEPYGELKSRCEFGDDFVCKDRNLLVDDKLLVIYKLPIMYFVSPKRKDLSDLIENFFTNQHDQFLSFFNEHPLVKDALAKLKGRTIYKIDNAVLSEKTALIPDKYWLN